MDRRRLLSAMAGIAGLAGCVGGPGGRGGGPEPTPTPDRTATRAGNRTSVAGVDLPVSSGRLQRSVRRDAIPAITDPAFARDWSGLEVSLPGYSGGGTIRPRLRADDRVIGVARGGEARAYPLRVLNWHEIVNDVFEPGSSDGQSRDGPLLVTYCPLCRSGITAVRRVRGEETSFGVSGELWMANLVMYDGVTDSRWSQVAATAIRGPMTGTTLDLVPSTITTWSEWRADHPDTAVLLPPPESNTVRGREPHVLRDYTENPYAGYDDSTRVGPGSTFDDDRLHPKTLVIGVVAGGAAKAYPLPAVRDAGVVNDRVGELPVVVAATPDDALVAYDRRVGGAALRFEPAGRASMRADGSRWRIAAGRAVDGPHEGTRLAPANDIPALFWFSWLDFHPDTGVYG